MAAHSDPRRDPRIQFRAPRFRGRRGLDARPRRRSPRPFGGHVPGGVQRQFATTDLVLLAAVVRSFGAKVVVDPELKAKVLKTWELPAARAAYALGLWVDKIIMWHASLQGECWWPERYGRGRATIPRCSGRSCPPYRSLPCSSCMSDPVLLSYSAPLPHENAAQASLRELNQVVKRIGAHVVSSMFGLFGALIVIAGMMMLISFLFMGELGQRPSYMGIFRVSLCAMVFYTQRHVLLQLPAPSRLASAGLVDRLEFLVFQCGCHLGHVTIRAGFFGYGNMIAATVSLVIGFSLVLNEVSLASLPCISSPIILPLSGRHPC